MGQPLPVPDHARPGRGRARLADPLGIERWALVVGGSMGGMRALEWAVTHPDRVARLFVLACTPYATADADRLVRTTARGDPVRPGLPRRRLLRRGAGGRAAGGLGVARRIAHMTYRSEQRARHPLRSTPQAERAPVRRRRAVRRRELPRPSRRQAGRAVRRQLLRGADEGDEHPRRRPRPGWRRGRPRAGHRPHRGRGDRLRPALPARAERAVAASVPTAGPVHVIESLYGHDGFLIETDAVAKAVGPLLD